MNRRPNAFTPGPGQESVWDYPRPPALDPTTELVVVEFAGRVVARTRRAIRVLETSHPPSYYLPPDDVDPSLLQVAAHRTWCENPHAPSRHARRPSCRCPGGRGHGGPTVSGHGRGT